MSEGAIDLGGPQREFLTLIMHYLANSQMFCSGIEEDKKVLNNFSKGQWVYPWKGILSQAKIANIMQSDNNRILPKFSDHLIVNFMFSFSNTPQGESKWFKFYTLGFFHITGFYFYI